MQKLGTIIYNAVKRGLPELSSGVFKMPPKAKFSLQNPYILEVLPEGIDFKKLESLNNKKLRTVCRILDSPECDEIMGRYKSFCKTYSNSKVDSTSFINKRIKNLKLYNSNDRDLYIFNFNQNGDIIINPRRYGSDDLQFLSHIKQGKYVKPDVKPEGTYPCTEMTAEFSNKLAKKIIYEDEHFIDGYRYCGSHAHFDKDGKNISNFSNGSETIIVDRTIDDTLRSTIAAFKNRINSKKMTEKEKMNELMFFVDEIFSIDKSNKKISELTSNLGCGQEVLLGELINSGAGVCRHRSLLSKVLADEIGLESRMIQGYYKNGGHAWNEIIVDNETYLFDVMQSKIINISTPNKNIVPQAFEYYIENPQNINNKIRKYFDPQSPVSSIYNGIKGKSLINTNEAILKPTENGYIIEPLSKNVMVNGKQIVEKMELNTGDFVNLKDIGFQIL